MRWRLADGPQDLRGFGLLAAPVLPELERNSASDVLHRLNAYIGMGAMTRSCQSNWEYRSDPWLRSGMLPTKRGCTQAITAFRRPCRTTSSHGSSESSDALERRLKRGNCQLRSRASRPPCFAASRYSRKANTTTFAVFLSTGQIGEFVPATKATRWTPSIAYVITPPPVAPSTCDCHSTSPRVASNA